MWSRYTLSCKFLVCTLNCLAVRVLIKSHTDGRDGFYYLDLERMSGSQQKLLPRWSRCVSVKPTMWTIICMTSGRCWRCRTPWWSTGSGTFKAWFGRKDTVLETWKITWVMNLNQRTGKQGCSCEARQTDSDACEPTMYTNRWPKT